MRIVWWRGIVLAMVTGVGVSTGGCGGLSRRALDTDEGTDGGQPAARERPAVIPAATMLGEDDGTLGSSASFVGDLDRDGFDDLVVMDSGATGPPASVEVQTLGAAYVFYGRASVPAALNVESADLILRGGDDNVTKLGDVDGDGFDDFAFTLSCESVASCPTTDGVHIIYGGAERLTGNQRSDEIGIRWTAPQSDAHYRVRGVGDVNGDGRGDVIIDAASWPGGTDVRVISYLLLGRSDRNAQAPRAGFADAVFQGDSENCQVDYGSAPAGDLDGDGFGDILISIKGSNDSGKTALFYGGPDRFMGAIAACDDADATFGWPPNTLALGGLGDLDNDGFSDVGLGERGLDGGLLRVVFGGPERLSGLNDAAVAVFSVSTPVSLDALGSGDVNGDGRIDLLLGDAGANDSDGWLALLAGTADRPTGVVSITDQNVILTGHGTTAAGGGKWPGNLGSSVAANGDFNRDGVADIIVTAPSGNAGEGRAYLILGGGFPN